MVAWFRLSIPLLACVALATGCTVRVPRPAGIGLQVNATARVNARVQAPAPTETIVALENAPVVEFFGVPLEGADEVVFVLDTSGSMTEPAQGQLATYVVPPPPAVAPSPPSPPSPPLDRAPGGVSVGEGSPPSPQPAPAPVPPDQPPYDTQVDPGGGQVQVATRAPTKIEVARAELVAALQQLPPGTRLNVIYFNNTVRAYGPGIASLDEDVRADLLGFVAQMGANGATALAPAMRTALLMNPRRIVLLSDGLGNVGGNAAAILRDARAAIRGGVRIDTIGLGRGQDAALLHSLASESGGLYQAL
jgi:hypothetical protein